MSDQSKKSFFPSEPTTTKKRKKNYRPRDDDDEGITHRASPLSFASTASNPANPKQKATSQSMWKLLPRRIARSSLFPPFFNRSLAVSSASWSFSLSSDCCCTSWPIARPICFRRPTDERRSATSLSRSNAEAGPPKTETETASSPPAAPPP